MAGLATSGTLTHWFRDQLARDLPRETAFAPSPPRPSPRRRGRAASSCCRISRANAPDPRPKRQGRDLRPELTHSRADLYRATLEGIACATRAITDCTATAGQPPNRVRAVGGGTRNRLWLQATSDITGLDQTLCRTTTGAAYGDAFLAALATGQATPDRIDRWNPPETVTRAQHHPAYDRLYPLFQRLYRQTRDIAADLDQPA